MDKRWQVDSIPVFFARAWLQDIAGKTRELLDNLKSMAATDDGEGSVSVEVLREKHLPASTENFLLNLAAAEGILQVWAVAPIVDTCWLFYTDVRRRWKIFIWQAFNYILILLVEANDL